MPKMAKKRSKKPKSAPPASTSTLKQVALDTPSAKIALASLDLPAAIVKNLKAANPNASTAPLRVVFNSLPPAILEFFRMSLADLGSLPPFHGPPPFDLVPAAEGTFGTEFPLAPTRLARKPLNSDVLLADGYTVDTYVTLYSVEGYMMLDQCALFSPSNGKLRQLSRAPRDVKALRDKTFAMGFLNNDMTITQQKAMILAGMYSNMSAQTGTKDPKIEKAISDMIAFGSKLPGDADYEQLLSNICDMFAGFTLDPHAKDVRDGRLVLINQPDQRPDVKYLPVSAATVAASLLYAKASLPISYVKPPTIGPSPPITPGAGKQPRPPVQAVNSSAPTIHQRPLTTLRHLDSVSQTRRPGPHDLVARLPPEWRDPENPVYAVLGLDTMDAIAYKVVRGEFLQPASSLIDLDAPSSSQPWADCSLTLADLVPVSAALGTMHSKLMTELRVLHNSPTAEIRRTLSYEQAQIRTLTLVAYDGYHHYLKLAGIARIVPAFCLPFFEFMRTYEVAIRVGALRFNDWRW